MTIEATSVESTVTQPLVSIGIPTYCRPEGLRRLLESLVKQTYPNLEIIVSDNCSPNQATEQVVREFMEVDARIRYYRQPQNIGLFYNYKFVLDSAEGDYFTWACDDDNRSPRFVEVCLQALQQNENLILANTFSQLVDANMQAIALDKGCSTIGYEASQRYKKYLSSIWKEQAGVGDILFGLARRSTFVHSFQSLPNILSWDHVLLARLALEGEFLTLPEVLMTSGAGGNSTCNSRTAKAQLIQGSRSERQPGWIRECYLQESIYSSSNLSMIEKVMLSIWSYFNYLGFYYKMIARGIAPGVYDFAKKHLTK